MALFFWVGLDGTQSPTGSQDVVQAGTDAKMVVGQVQNGWFAVTSYLMWAEWFPDQPIVIQNIVIAPSTGNFYHDAAWMSDSTGSGLTPNGYMWFQFYNEGDKDGPSVRACIGPAGSHNPSCVGTISHGQQFVGDSAEWIMEKPIVTGHLENFVNAQMQYAYAYRSDEGYHVAHHDGEENYNGQWLYDNAFTYQEATANSQGSNANYGLVNYGWLAY